MKNNTHRTSPIGVYCLICAMILVTCSCKNRRTEEEPYSGGYSPLDLTTIEQQEGYPAVQFPVNQLVVYAATGVSHEDMISFFSGQDDITLIGQIPSIGYYQVEVSSASKSELDAIKSTLASNKKIQGAAYNIIMSERDDPGSCPTEPDVLMSFIPEEDKLPYYQISYQTALEIMQGLRDMISLHTVTIGVVENGFSARTGQFTDVTIENCSVRTASGRRVRLDGTDRHGTSVAGIICADNDGTEVNGLASTLIGSDRLRVLMARPQDNDFMAYCAAIANMIDEGGANIINNSFGQGPFDNETARETIDSITAFKELMNRYPDVLFVNAAPNDTVELNGRNDAPAGISLGNTLTVTYWIHDDASEIALTVGYGDLVDIAAPGDNVVVLMPDGTAMRDYGTSFAAPMVTSAAALLKAIEPSLSPDEIKGLLLDPSFHGETTEPDGGVQLDIAAPLIDLLWQKYQGSPWAEYLLDNDDDDLHDIAEIVKATICEQTGLKLENYGSFTFEPDSACASGVEMIMEPDGSQWSLWMPNLFNESYDRLGVTLSSAGSDIFGVNETYSLSVHSVSVNVMSDHMTDDTDCTSVDPEDGDFIYSGYSDSGCYSFTRCGVSQRNADGKPKYLTVDLFFEGTIDGYKSTYYPSSAVEPIVIDEENAAVEGWIKNVRVQTMDPFGTFSQAVEEACLKTGDNATGGGSLRAETW